MPSETEIDSRYKRIYRFFSGSSFILPQYHVGYFIYFLPIPTSSTSVSTEPIGFLAKLKSTFLCFQYAMKGLLFHCFGRY